MHTLISTIVLRPPSPTLSAQTGVTRVLCWMFVLAASSAIHGWFNFCIVSYDYKLIITCFFFLTNTRYSILFIFM